VQLDSAFPFGSSQAKSTAEFQWIPMVHIHQVLAASDRKEVAKKELMPSLIDTPRT
jgi:hypothetical protein